MDKRLKWFFTGFLITMAALGMAFTVHGPITSDMMATLGINSAERGLLIALQGVGTLASSIIWIIFGERFNKARLLAIGTLITAAGSLLLVLGFGYYGMMPVLMVFGFGVAIIEIMDNAVAMDVQSAKINIVFYLHLAIGIGAVAGSLLTASISQNLGWQYAYLAVAALMLAGLLFYSISLKRAHAILPYKDNIGKVEAPALGSANKKPLILVFIGSIFFSVQEVGTLAWLSRYFETSLGLSAGVAVAAVPIFYGGFVMSRFFTPFMLRKIKTKTLFIFGTILSSAALALLAWVQGATVALILTLLAGLFGGSSYPLVLTMGNECIPHNSSAVSAVTYLGFTVAALSVPYLMGLIETAFAADLRVSFIVVSVMAVISIACFIPLKVNRISVNIS